MSLSPGIKSQRALTRAALFAGALVFLWIAVQGCSFSPSALEPPVFSDESGAVAMRPSETQVHPTDNILWRPGVVVTFLLLAGGIGIAVYLRRKAHAGSESNDSLRPLGGLPIGPGQQLKLVECGGEVLLLGITASSITLLHKLDPDQLLQRSVDSAMPGTRRSGVPASDINSIGRRPADLTPSEQKNFASLLKSYLGVDPGSNGHQN